MYFEDIAYYIIQDNPHQGYKKPFRSTLISLIGDFTYITFFISDTEYTREDHPNLYYWAEMKEQEKQTYNI